MSHSPQSAAELQARLINLNQQLLDSIVNLDYETYDRLCADDMSCMEPESNQTVVVGKSFHKYYFDVYGNKGECSERTSKPIPTNVTMVQPHVQLLRGGTGDILSYIKLVQQKERTVQQSETRVWELRDGHWLNIHFHKSPPASP